jgi:triacylglycerol lipase
VLGKQRNQASSLPAITPRRAKLPGVSAGQWGVNGAGARVRVMVRADLRPLESPFTFAGTDPVNFANWITDFDWIPKSGDLHTGFRMAADATWNDSRAAAQTAAQFGAKLYIAGHSLGGALATLTANRLQHELGIVADAVYTYGMPRTGGPGLVAEYGAVLGARTFRFVHGGDIVPSVPPPELGFRHVGRLLSCIQFNKFAPPPPDDWSLNNPLLPDTALAGLREQIDNLWRGGAAIDRQAPDHHLAFQALPLGISDHLPDRYLLALSKE